MDQSIHSSLPYPTYWWIRAYTHTSTLPYLLVDQSIYTHHYPTPPLLPTTHLFMDQSKADIQPVSYRSDSGEREREKKHTHINIQQNMQNNNPFATEGPSTQYPTNRWEGGGYQVAVIIILQNTGLTTGQGPGDQPASWEFCHMTL